MPINYAAVVSRMHVRLSRQATLRCAVTPCQQPVHRGLFAGLLSTRGDCP